jgi:hypothetical protein
MPVLDRFLDERFDDNAAIMRGNFLPMDAVCCKTGLRVTGIDVR